MYVYIVCQKVSVKCECKGVNVRKKATSECGNTQAANDILSKRDLDFVFFACFADGTAGGPLGRNVIREKRVSWEGERDSENTKERTKERKRQKIIFKNPSRLTEYRKLQA